MRTGAPALVFVALGAPALAWADPAPSVGLAAVGPVWSLRAGDDQDMAWSVGAEAGFHWFPHRRTMLTVGAVTDAVWMWGPRGDGFVGTLAGEASYWGFGVEAGGFVDTGALGYGAAAGPAVGAFWSGAFLWVGVRAMFPLARAVDAAEAAPMVNLTMGLKLPVWSVDDTMPEPEIHLFDGMFRNIGRQGLPLRDADGAVTVAALVEGSAWRAGAFAPDADEDTRAALAGAWRDDGRMEHAAVAAFARRSLELVALGAPPSLVERAHRAALDEAAHARLCFAIAEAYDGRPLDPGALPEALAGGFARTHAALAEASFRDGCVYEAAASALAREGARTAADPALRCALTGIADDEARHAELAWDMVAWCLDAGGDAARDALAGAAATANAEVAAGVVESDAHGRPTLATRAEVVRRACDEAARRAWVLLASRRRRLADATGRRRSTRGAGVVHGPAAWKEGAGP